MNNITNWSDKIPENGGQYFYYGDPFTSTPSKSWENKLYLVNVYKQSSGKLIFFIEGGHFLSNKSGMWLEVKLVLPKPYKENVEK